MVLCDAASAPSQSCWLFPVSNMLSSFHTALALPPLPDPGFLYFLRLALCSLLGLLPLILQVSAHIPPPRRGLPKANVALPPHLFSSPATCPWPNSIIPSHYSPEFLHSTDHCLKSLTCPFMYLLFMDCLSPVIVRDNKDSVLL